MEDGRGRRDTAPLSFFENNARQAVPACPTMGKSLNQEPWLLLSARFALCTWVSSTALITGQTRHLCQLFDLCQRMSCINSLSALNKESDTSKANT